MRKLFLATALLGSLGMMASPAVAQDGNQGGEQGAEVFERMDQNDDGKISEDEAKANAMSRFEEIDANGDGKVTDADINDRVDAMKEENPDVPDRRFKRQKQVLKAQFKRLDENGDGELSADEYTQSALSRHENLDQNGDGMVTKEEIEEVRKQMRKQIQQQRQKMQQQKGGNQ